MKRGLLLLFILFGTSFLVTARSCPVFAIDPVTIEEQTSPSPDLGYQEIKDSLPRSIFGSVDELLNSILGTDGAGNNQLFLFITLIVGVLAVFGMIVSGIMYITAGGDPDKASRARNNIIWILTGVILYISAFWLLGVIRSFLNNPLLGP